jgi:redox-sensing transcriptional repressor
MTSKGVIRKAPSMRRQRPPVSPSSGSATPPGIPQTAADIPRKTVYRLSLYLRCLGLMAANRESIVSSAALASVAGVQPAQLRRDLAFCGPLGKRGTGYEVQFLRKRLGEILGRARLQPVILVGAGHLGQALLSYRGFAREGFEIVSAFDLHPQKSRMGKIPVQGMSRIAPTVRKREIRMAILCVPGHAAQSVADHLVEAGIHAILNFSPAVLHLPESIAVNNVNLAIELENLSYFAR